MKKFLIFAIAIMMLLCVSCYMEVETPVASVQSGTYSESQVITLSCSNENLRIFYTLDGSSPLHEKGIEYTGSITIDSTSCIPRTILKAACKNVIGKYSPVVEFRYIILGPGGGYVFYDKGSYSDGWRYLEASPVAMRAGQSTSIYFGYYRNSENGSNRYVNESSYVAGTSDANDGKSTGTAVGTGKANTAKLVSKMGSAVYARETGSDTTANYAAKLCDDYENNGCGDWFLPSKDELNLMYDRLARNSIGGVGFSWYMSSSESGVNSVWVQSFDNGVKSRGERFYPYAVRAVRYF